VSQLQALREVHTETMPFDELATRINGFSLEPRCRVCRNDEMRRKVNDLLASGISYAMVLRALEQDNAKLDQRDRVTIDSIRCHTRRHFPVQNVARATYRAILEQRAKENGVDFVQGVATAITPMAFFETIMVKGYETLVDSDTKVDVNTAMVAAGRLQALIESRASGTRMVEIMAQMGRIIDAIHATVPEELWPEILRKIDGPVAADSLADEFEGAEDEYDAVESAQADQDRSTRCAGTRQFHRRGQEEVAITEKVQLESAHRPVKTFTPSAKVDDYDSF
jgi:hypothetical protein